MSALLAIIAIPFYMLILPAGFIGLILRLLAPHWLPSWAQSIPPYAFVGVIVTIVVWLTVVMVIQAVRRGPLHDYCGLESIGDGLSGYLLAVGLLIAFVVFRLLMR